MTEENGSGLFLISRMFKLGEEIQFLLLEFDRFQTLVIGTSHESLSNKV
jgi:hypothetical protein